MTLTTDQELDSNQFISKLVKVPINYFKIIKGLVKLLSSPRSSDDFDANLHENLHFSNVSN